MTRSFATLIVVLLWASAQGLASSPPRSDPCVEAQAVDAPCVGVLLPDSQARSLLKCVKADLPECRELAELRAQELEAELKAAKAHAASQRTRADKLAKLLEETVAPPPPAPEWWQTPEFAVTMSIAAAGLLTAVVVLATVGD